MRTSIASAALRIIAFTSSLLLAAAASAEPSAAVRSFHDGARVVEVEVASGEAAPRAGTELSAVRLRYPGRAREVRAFVDRTAIVKLDPGAEGELDALGARLVRPLMPSIGLFMVEDTAGGDGVDLARRLQPGAPRERGIREATPNLYVRHARRGDFVPNDPRLSGQWYFDNLKMTEAWGLYAGDAKTSIVIVDTGCDLAHPDLVGKLDPGRDVVDGDDDPSPDVTENGAEHGTACAGLAAASTDNGEGIAGGCPACRLRCVRLLADTPVPIGADIEAFDFAFQNDAAVVSNSWGFVDPIPVPALLEEAINNVFDNGRGGKGALVLFAIGNDDREVGDDEMQAVRGVLAIGAINNLDDQTSFTNFGACSDLVAPTGTLTTDIAGPAGGDPGDYTNLFGGTSSACPVAAGIAGLLAGAAPDRTSAELYEVLIQTARPAPYAVPDANGHDPVFGYGIIDPVKALEKVMGIGGAGGAGGGGVGGGGGTGGGAGGDGGSPEEPGGCGCTAAGEGGGGTGLVVYSALLGAVLARRRRRGGAGRSPQRR